MSETPAPAPLEPLPRGWERMLCVVAHPDDMEFGAAAAVARWTGQGKWVGYCMVTSGEAGIDGMEPGECRRVREAEEIESARIVGVDNVDFLGAARRRARVRRPAAPRDLRRPYAGTGPTSWSPATSATRGEAGTSTRPTTSPPVGRSSTRCATPATAGSSTTSSPTGSSRGEASSRSGRSAPRSAGHGVDTTETFDAGVESLKAHAAYIQGLGWENWDEREFLEGMARAHRPAPRCHVRGAVRGVPDGLGRLGCV